MGLCGSFRCGCGVTSTPAVSGAINGELPSIMVAGSGQPGDPYDLTINEGWVDQLVAGYPYGPIPCTSSTRPASPLAGMRIFETDTLLGYIYDGTGWVMVEVIGAWPTWTPTVTQSGSVTVTVSRAVYHRSGRKVHVMAKLVVSGSGTGGNAVQISLPFTAAASGMYNGNGYIYDASTGIYYPGIADFPATTYMCLMNTTTAVASNNLLGVAAFTAGLANGDLINLSYTYDAAS
jgi:hypothetical protein